MRIYLSRFPKRFYADYSVKTELTPQQIRSYRDNGFIVLDDFLSPPELQEWREAVDEAVGARGDVRIPGQNVPPKSEYYSKVFKQRVNLWQTSERMKKIMIDERLGKIAMELSGADGIRVWHDQAL